MFNDPDSLLNVLFRWSHIIFGIIWLGHLYFFNLVNVPFQGDLEKDLKPRVNPKLLLRAFYWFRWGAMYTFVLGILLFGSSTFTRGCSSSKAAASATARSGSFSAPGSAPSCGSTSGS